MLEKIIALIDKNETDPLVKMKMVSFLNSSVAMNKLSDKENETMDDIDRAFLEMAQLNFTYRLEEPKYDNSLESYFRLVFNEVNSELQNKVVSKSLVKTLLTMSSLERSIIMMTNNENIITLFFTNIVKVQNMQLENEYVDNFYDELKIISINEEEEFFIRVTEVELRKILPGTRAVVKQMANYHMSTFDGMLYHIRLLE